MVEVRGKQQQRTDFMQEVKYEKEPEIKRRITGRRTKSTLFAKRGMALSLGLLLVAGLGIAGHRINKAQQLNKMVQAVEMGEISLPTDEGMLNRIIEQYTRDYNITHRAESRVLLQGELKPEEIEMTELNGKIFVKKEGQMIEQNDLENPFKVDSVVANYTEVYQIYQAYQNETDITKKVELYKEYLAQTVKLEKRIEGKEKTTDGKLDPAAERFLNEKARQQNGEQAELE